MRIKIAEITQPWMPATHECKLRERYRSAGGAKRGKANAGGNSGNPPKHGVLPVGIRRRPRGKTRYG